MDILVFFYVGLELIVCPDSRYWGNLQQPGYRRERSADDSTPSMLDSLYRDTLQTASRTASFLDSVQQTWRITETKEDTSAWRRRKKKPTFTASILKRISV